MDYRFPVFVACYCLVLALMTQTGQANPVNNTQVHPSSPSPSLNNTMVNHRKEKLFNIFSVMRIDNSQCNASNSNNVIGTCTSAMECRGEGGTASGSCAAGFGVCCVFNLGCSASTSRNMSYFTSTATTNSLFYNSDNSLTQSYTCEINVQKTNKDICQLRLDFKSFSIAQPDGDGLCTTDQFIVVGAANRVPTICGDNTNQHLLLHMKPGQSQWKLRFTLNTMMNAQSRTWNIKMSQIPCNSILTSDPNCLQYYQGASGRIQSFNFAFLNTAQASTLGLPGRQLSNQNYAICLRVEDGFCAIKYTACTDSSNNNQVSSSFALTGDFSIAPANEALQGIFCQWDYLEIPGGYGGQNSAITTDRFCGTALNTGFLARTNIPILSNRKPFILRYVTDGVEGSPNPTNPLGTDGRNTGFCIDYAQVACA